MRPLSHWSRAANADLFDDGSQTMYESTRDGHLNIMGCSDDVVACFDALAWRTIVPGAAGAIPISQGVS
jgi:hypothetical protein